MSSSSAKKNKKYIKPNKSRIQAHSEHILIQNNSTILSSLSFSYI